MRSTSKNISLWSSVYYFDKDTEARILFEWKDQSNTSLKQSKCNSVDFFWKLLLFVTSIETISLVFEKENYADQFECPCN